MDLKKYLEDIGIPITTFARRINVAPRTIYHILEGNDIKLSIAIKIELATKGKVKCKDLYSIEKVKEQMQPKPLVKTLKKTKSKKSLDKTKAK